MKFMALAIPYMLGTTNFNRGQHMACLAGASPEDLTQPNFVADGAGRLKNNFRTPNGEALPTAGRGLSARGLRDAASGLRI